METRVVPGLRDKDFLEWLVPPRLLTCVYIYVFQYDVINDSIAKLLRFSRQPERTSAPSVIFKRLNDVERRSVEPEVISKIDS